MDLSFDHSQNLSMLFLSINRRGWEGFGKGFGKGLSEGLRPDGGMTRLYYDDVNGLLTLSLLLPIMLRF